MKIFDVLYKGINIRVTFAVPAGQEHLAEQEWNRLNEYLEKFYRETEIT